MDTRFRQGMRFPKVAAGIAFFIIGTAAAAAATGTGWFRTGPVPASPEVIDSPASPAARAPRPSARCGECGVIESTRRLAPVGDAPALQEITVRLANGSTRVLSESSPALWRPGETAIVIEGWSKPGV